MTASRPRPPGNPPCRSTWRRGRSTLTFPCVQGTDTVARIRPLPANTYRLSDFYRAQSEFMSTSFVGKLVVVPDSKWDAIGAPHAR